MDKRILAVALATLLAACGGDAESEPAQETAPAGATIEGVEAPAAVPAAPVSTDSANMGATAAPMDSAAAGTVTPPSMGTDSAASH